MNVNVKYKGDLKNTFKFLKSNSKKINMSTIELFVTKCIKQLTEATPVKTGLTSKSWSYTIKRDKQGVTVTIENSNIQNGLNIAILIDTGHATKDGSYIPGLHYISPIVNNTFKEIIDNAWKELNG